MPKYALFSLFVYEKRFFYEKGRFPQHVSPTTKGGNFPQNVLPKTKGGKFINNTLLLLLLLLLSLLLSLRCAVWPPGDLLRNAPSAGAHPPIYTLAMSCGPELAIAIAIAIG